MRYARVHSLTFEMPRPDSGVVVRAEIHHVTEDAQGAVTMVSGAESEIFRLLRDVGMETVRIVDPVTENGCSLSVAGLAIAVEAAVKKWMLEEIPGRLDKNGKLILEN